MASSRIDLEFGGKYSVGEQFRRLDSDLKAAGKSTKDMGEAMKSTATEAANALGSKLNPSLSQGLNLLQKMAQGGIWGAISVAAGAAISFVVDKWREAKEQATQYAEICRERVVESMKAIGERFTGVSKEAALANAEARELLAVLNGGVASRSEMKIHQLTIQQLQATTDDLDAAGRAVVAAQFGLKIASEKASAATEQAANTTKFAQDAVTQATQKRTEAEAGLAEAQKLRADFEQEATRYGTGWLAEYKNLQTQAAQTTKDLMADNIAYEHALRFQKSAALALSKFEEEHKQEVQSLNEVTKQVKVASENLEAAKREETTATRALKTAQEKEAVARSAAEVAVAQATAKLHDAAKAQESSNAAEIRKVLATDAAAEITEKCNAAGLKEAEYIRIYTDAVAKGVNHVDALAAANSRIAADTDKARVAAMRKADIDEYAAKIQEDCAKAGVNATEYMRLYTKAINLNYEASNAYNIAQARLNSAIEERAAEEEKAKTSAYGDPNLKGSALFVKVDVGGIGNGVERALNYKDSEKRRRQAERDARNAFNQAKEDIVPTIRWLQGDMPEDQAKRYVKYMQSQYTPAQIRELGKLAMNSQLLSKGELQRQKDAIIKMADQVAAAMQAK